MTAPSANAADEHATWVEFDDDEAAMTAADEAIEGGPIFDGEGHSDAAATLSAMEEETDDACVARFMCF